MIQLYSVVFFARWHPKIRFTCAFAYCILLYNALQPRDILRSSEERTAYFLRVEKKTASSLLCSVCLPPASSWFLAWLTFRSWWRTQYVPSKRWWRSTELHCITSVRLYSIGFTCSMLDATNHVHLCKSWAKPTLTSTWWRKKKLRDNATV
jgi:hypothetical protein